MKTAIKRTLSIFTAALLVAMAVIPAAAATDMGKCKVETAMPAGFDKAIVIEGETYEEGNSANVQTQKAADGTPIEYVYLKASENDKPAYAKYTFNVETHGKYSLAAALRTKTGTAFRDGKIVIDDTYSYYVERTDTAAGNTIEYATGFNQVELKPGKHTITLYLGDGFDDNKVKSIHLDKILVKLDSEIKASASASSPSTADGTALALLACASAAAAGVIVWKKRR